MIAGEILYLIKYFLLLKANAPRCGQSSAITFPSKLSILLLDIQYHTDTELQIPNLAFITFAVLEMLVCHSVTLILNGLTFQNAFISRSNCHGTLVLSIKV